MKTEKRCIMCGEIIKSMLIYCDKCLKIPFIVEFEEYKEGDNNEN